MRVCVIGSGYVGLVTGACLADSGNHVICVDNDTDKVARLSKGECPIFEPGLAELMGANMRAGRLRFTANLVEGVSPARVVFIAVGTPPKPDGSADLSAVEAVAAGVGQALSGHTIVVNKSTVPVGTGARVEAIMARHTQHPFDVVSNPEFLKEGTAVDDFLRPDRVVIGADNPEAAETIAELYKPFVRNNKPIHCMSRLAAEMSKYAANAYLSTRISFINEVAEICERFDVNVDEVRIGMGSDARIGYHFLYPGVGYGGSCFPKDVQALADTARSAGVECQILDAVHRRNQKQRALMVRKVLDRLGKDLKGKRLAVWGLAFKPKTDDIREAPAITIISELLEAGAEIVVYDPEALDNTRAVFGERLGYSRDAYEMLTDVDALLIMTEWNEFRSPDFDTMRARMKQPLIFDGRNIYANDTIAGYNIEYHSVGRPVVKP
ncbi:MAG: UDP-glucose/GDP-mannose dehydrogenase family protein [Planctomycetes bacterium]|nr:UDP-glucose/GDP-mannose dehydrogenase family protein [Planctomycetota bacterium]